MPGTPRPIVHPRFGNLTPFTDGIHDAQQQARQLVAGRPSISIVDQFGNTTQLWGANLSQVVTIGASHGVPGVQVSTGLPLGTAGVAYQSGPAVTTINLTRGSPSATVGTVTGAGLSKGQVIGAADVADVTSGTPTPAIVPGTTISAVSGTSVTLSQNAAESGTGLLCAAARFILQSDSGWVPLALVSPWTAASGYYTPSVRQIADRVYLSGGIASGVTVPPSTFTTLPAAFRPTANFAGVIADTSGSVFNTLTVLPSGAVSLSSPPSSDTFDLDPISFRLI